MQELKAAQQPAFRIDSALLASTQPGLVLSQSSCSVCDPMADAAAEVGPSQHDLSSILDHCRLAPGRLLCFSPTTSACGPAATQPVRGRLAALCCLVHLLLGNCVWWVWWSVSVGDHSPPWPQRACREGD